ncbi:MAG: hypothetical protein C4532_01700 [Candidatus Abyssobacteria bacterium SURF_17]|uniref:Uncharacterized protein n=1 Tax=Candidatus Abyssobacteria bacterium SURF_17 TaxID=2093361 RepID=A0A419F8J7_9BACT|nr:MAG: hypothetical protein C4532_01700 [Candidatus Abyssubacteria bacterium SURF_17]
MFEKIFGIFRKRKKTGVSQEIPGETADEMFDVGEGGLGDEFDADTISLETGMSDGGFVGSSGGMADSGPGLAESASVTGPPLDEELGLGLDVGEEPAEEAIGFAPKEERISPPPEVEEYAPRARTRGIVTLLKTGVVFVVVALVGLAAGFFGVKPGAEIVEKLLTKGPTPKERLAQLNVENVQLEQELAAYRAVGTIEEIVAVRDEVNKRMEMSKHMETIETKVADRPAQEERLDQVSEQLKRTQQELIVQKGSLANVQKAIKQIEARSDYLMSSTRKHLDQIEEAGEQVEMLKARLSPERIERAENAASSSRDIQEGLEQTVSDALSSS